MNIIGMLVAITPISIWKAMVMRNHAVEVILKEEKVEQWNTEEFHQGMNFVITRSSQIPVPIVAIVYDALQIPNAQKRWVRVSAQCSSMIPCHGSRADELLLMLRRSLRPP